MLICILQVAQSLAAGPVRAAKPVPATQAPASNAEFQNVRVRAAVTDAQKRLGDLEPFQKRMFEDEVLPQAGLFVRNTQSTAQGLNVDVDVDAIRAYLSFYGPRSLGVDDPKNPLAGLALLSTAPDCTKCMDSLPLLRKQVASRFEHRGMKTIFASDEDLPPALKDAKSAARSLEGFAGEAARAKGAAASLTLVWKPLVSDEIDSAHGDERHYVVSVVIDVPKIGHAETQAEIMDEDSFEVTVARLLTEAWTRVGTAKASSAAPRAEGQREVLIELKGVKDYAHYLKLKESLQAKVAEKLGEAVTLEDRVIARGLLVVAARTNKPAEETREKLADLKLADPEIETGVPQ